MPTTLQNSVPNPSYNEIDLGTKVLTISEVGTQNLTSLISRGFSPPRETNNLAYEYILTADLYKDHQNCLLADRFCCSIPIVALRVLRIVEVLEVGYLNPKRPELEAPLFGLSRADGSNTSEIPLFS